MTRVADSPERNDRRYTTDTAPPPAVVSARSAPPRAVKTRQPGRAVQPGACSVCLTCFVSASQRSLCACLMRGGVGRARGGGVPLCFWARTKYTALLEIQIGMRRGNLLRESGVGGMHQNIQFTHLIVRYDEVDLRLAVVVCYTTSLEEAKALLSVFIALAPQFAPRLCILFGIVRSLVFTRSTLKRREVR